jgi:hypothetical protein
MPDQSTLAANVTRFSMTVDIEAPPERVLGVLCDLERWPEWTCDDDECRSFGVEALDQPSDSALVARGAGRIPSGAERWGAAGGPLSQHTCTECDLSFRSAIPD